MNADHKAIQDYLLQHGPQTTVKLFARLGAGVVSEGGFKQRLWNAQKGGFIRLTSGHGVPGIWAAVEEYQPAPVKAPAPSYAGQIVPPRQYDLMRAPPLVHHDMQPSRPGAANHQQYASRRGDDLIAHQRPIHMCSQLKGGMQ